jgi:hypothetical protein
VIGSMLSGNQAQNPLGFVLGRFGGGTRHRAVTRNAVA